MGNSKKWQIGCKTCHTIFGHGADPFFYKLKLICDCLLKGKQEIYLKLNHAQ